MANLADFKTPVQRHKFWFQYITTPTSDTSGTLLLLHFDTKRYLFGRISEGTQRACIERGVALKKARSVFLTGETKWENNGGLLGMILTMADVISETPDEDKQALGDIVIHGGPKLWHTFAAARRFIFRTGMPMRVSEARPDHWKVSPEPDYFDENIQVWALPVEKAAQKDTKSTQATSTSHQPTSIEEEQSLRQKTVRNMFDSDWQKDKLYETPFKEVNLPAMVWLRDPATKELRSTYCAQAADAPHIHPDQKVLVRLPWPAALVPQLPSAGNLPSSISMCYLVRGRPQRGVFQMAKAKALGVTPGPTFGVLSSGKSVTLEDGTVITPEQVMDGGLPGYGMMVLDVPDVQYLPDLSSKLDSMNKASLLADVHAFMWTLGPGVMHSQSFSEVRARFGKVKHVVSYEDAGSDYIVMESSASSAARLNQIRPETFAVPQCYSAGPIHATSTDGDIIRAEKGLRLQAAPTFEVVRNEVPDPFEISEQVERMSGATRRLIPSTSASIVNEPFGDISITALGTGSAQPSKYRNVSANLLHIPSLGYFLLDAGENTLGQLKRIYGPAELDEILCNLHMIWISHLHADHHLGTMSILLAHKEAVRRKRGNGHTITHNLYVISEKNMADYLHDYSSVQDYDAILLRCYQSVITNLDYQPVRLSSTTLPLSKLDTCRVSHCQGAQAISATFTNGFKISYSGDCRPSAAFVEIGKDSDVLIHEATFDDGLEGDAIAKKHSTSGEAVGIAQAMRAKNVILTHFSQRYQKLPELSHVCAPQRLQFEEADEATGPPELPQDHAVSENMGNFSTFNANGTSNTLYRGTSLQQAAAKMPICVAFDYMRVTIPQIKDMYKYYPAIESTFEHEQKRSDDKRSTNRAMNEAVNKAKTEKNENARKKHEKKQGANSDKSQKQVQNRSQSQKDLPKNKPSSSGPGPTTSGHQPSPKDSTKNTRAMHSKRISSPNASPSRSPNFGKKARLDADST